MWKDREVLADQLSEDWFKARLGALTGSIVGEIMPGKTGKLPDWSNLLYQKAVQFMAGVDESKPIPQMNADWGHEWESVARDAYSMFTTVDIIEPGLIRSEFNDLVATSPDGITADGSLVLEIKAPMTMHKHLSYISKSPVTNLSSVKIEKCYYWQVRHHMLCTGAEVCDWASYHHMFDPKPLFIDRVDRCSKEMTMMQEVCSDFITDMKKFCKEILAA